MATLPGQAQTSDIEVLVEPDPDFSLSLEQSAPTPPAVPIEPHEPQAIKKSVSPRPETDIDARIKEIQARARAESEQVKQQKQEPSIDEQIQIIKENAQQSRLTDLREGIDSVFIDVLDLPGNILAGGLNLLLPGEPIPSDVFTKIAEKIGVLTPDEEREPVFGADPNRPPPTSEEYEFGRFMAENMLFTIVSPMLARLKTPEVLLPSGKLKELTKIQKIKRFFRGAGEMALEKPVQTVTIETMAGAGGAYGQLQGVRNYPDSAFAQFLTTTAGASSATLLPVRTLWGGLKHLKDIGMNRFGPSAAMRNAQSRVQRTAEDPTKALANLDNKDRFVPGFIDLLTPAERTMDIGMLKIQRAFFDELESFELNQFARWRKMHGLLVEIATTPKGTAEFTQTSVREGIEALDSILATRLQNAKDLLAKKVAERGTAITEREANLLGRELLEREELIASKTDRELWDLVDLEATVTSAPIRAEFEAIQREIRTESGAGLLKFTGQNATDGGANDLFKFIGKLTVKEDKLGQVTKFTSQAGKKTVFEKGSWGDEIDLGQVQSLRHRILQEKRMERAADAPNKRKIGFLIRLDEALMHSAGALERTKMIGPNTEAGARYLAALNFTRTFKERFGSPTIHKLMSIDKRGNVVPEDLTFSKIFTGSGAEGAAKGAAVVDEFIKAVTDPTARPEAVAEMKGAIENLIKGRFTLKAVDGDAINLTKAQNFLNANRKLLKKFPEIKRDIIESIREQSTLKIRERRFSQATKQVHDTKLSMATVYLNEPVKAKFDKIAKLSLLNNKEFEKQLNRMIRMTKRDKSGDARQGLNSAFMLWMTERSMHRKAGDIDAPEFLSGFQLKDLWGKESTQRIANRLLSQNEKDMMDKMVLSAEALDLARHAHAAKGGTFDTGPNAVITRLLRYAALKLSPLPSGGGGSIAAQQLLSQGAKEALEKRFRDPAVKILYDAFINQDEDLMRAMFMDIITPEDKAFVAKQVNAWLATALYNAGEKYINEEDE